MASRANITALINNYINDLGGAGSITHTEVKEILDALNTYLLHADDAPALYAAKIHTHVIADVTGLQAALDGKANLNGGSNTFTGDVTITGNLTVNGTKVTQNVETVEVEDNVMLLNNGETGAGVTKGASGIRVDRGTLDDFVFLFDEVRDKFVLGTLIDETAASIAALQVVATRQDAPISNALAYWNDSLKRFDTSSNLTFDGSNLVASGTLKGTTGIFTSLIDGNIPYHVSDTNGLGNSGLYWDVTNTFLGINITNVFSQLGSPLTVIGKSGNTNLARFFNADYATGIGSGIRIFTGAATGDTYTAIQAYDAGATSTNDLILQQVSGGNLGIGTTTTIAKLDVVGGNMVLSDTAATNTNKTSRIGARHYDITEEPFFYINAVVNNTSNILNLGGNYGIGNTATEISFFTAANNTTTVGTRAGQINSAGNWGIGQAAGTEKLEVNGTARATAFNEGGTLLNLKYAAISHTHTKSQITDFAHTHSIADVTGLQTALDGKAATNQTMYIGTTAVAINRASAALVLTGITSIDGSAATLTTARTLTIGATGKTFDGSANVTWTLGEIGAADAAHTHTFASLTSKPTTLGGYGITDAGNLNNNSWIGDAALQSLTSGLGNVAIGTNSLRGISTTSDNTAIGYLSMGLLTTANTSEQNTAVGMQALYSCSNAYYNTGIGKQSLYALTTGTNNTAAGNNVLRDLTTGQYNSVFGSDTGRGITTGSRNTIIGHGVQGLDANLQDNVIIATGNGNIRARFDATTWNFYSGIKVGNIAGGNYTEIKADGSLRFYGAATVWQDIDFPIIIRTTGANIPTITTINGNLQMPQWAVNDFNQCESQEFIHPWKEGSLVSWHLHMTTNGLDATIRYVKFEVEYGYVTVGGTWTFATLTTADIAIPANTPDKTMQIVSLGTFTPTGIKIGGHCIARLKRVAATGTAPTNNPWIPMLQLHIECDSLGSEEMVTKTSA